MPPETYRLPPQSEESERGVLGSVMIDSEKVLELCDNNGLKPESFYVPAHRHLFEQFKEMSQAGVAIDQLTVGQYLTKNKRLDSVGGWDFLEGLIDSTPTAAHAEYYIRFVREKCMLRSIIDEATQIIDRCYAEGDDDSETILSHAQSGLFDLSSSARLTDDKSIGEIASDVCERWEGIIDGTQTFGIEPFLPEIKAVMGNFVSGNPYFIAAEPGGGKSVVLQNQAVHTALQGIPTAIASLEMTKAKFVARILGDKGDFSSWAMDNREYGNTHHAMLQLEKAKRAAELIANIPLHIEDKPMDVDELCAWGMRMRSKHDIGLFGCDYFQLLDPPAKLRLKGQEATSYVCKKLQQVLKNEDVIKLVLSQITKLPRDQKTGAVTRKPRQDDLYGGRVIDAVSEGTIFIWDDDGDTKILVEKNRGGGIGERSVNFVKNRSRFESLVENKQEKEESLI